MRPVRSIVEDLKRIPNSFLPPGRPPDFPIQEVFGQGDHEAAVIIDVPEDIDYPDQDQFFDRLDSAVSNDEYHGRRGRGIDVLAWYSSFHHEDPVWGIFIPVSSLAYLETRLFPNSPLSRSKKWELAFALLLEHERMHFCVDYVCANWEVLLQTPCWAALWTRIAEGKLPYHEIEETVANAYMLRRCRSKLTANERNLLDLFVSRQPPGYREALNATSDGAFSDAFIQTVVSLIGLHAVERGLDARSASFKELLRIPDAKDIAANCPVYLVLDNSLLGLPPGLIRFIKQITNIKETPAFLKELKKLDHALQKSWLKMKDRMKIAIPPSAHFEKMKGEENVWAVRLNDNFRVHLRTTAEGIWEAFKVGSHKATGHG